MRCDQFHHALSESNKKYMKKRGHCDIQNMSNPRTEHPRSPKTSRSTSLGKVVLKRVVAEDS
jgi:hypothetical protein